MKITLASRTGSGKRHANEDSLCHGETQAAWYAVVADGAGGHSRGAEASARTVRTIEAILKSAGGEAFSPQVLSRIIEAAHSELQRLQSPGNPSAAMHSTVVVLWIDRTTRHALWAHVGDSRLYRIRNGLVDLVTSDDSLVQQMVAGGLITSEQARSHPHKNQLVAALGVDGDVDAHTVVRPIEVKDGDAFLLCSDGWWDCFDNTALERALERAQSAQHWLDLMQQAIEARDSPRQDNFSAVAVWIGNPNAAADAQADDTIPRRGA